MKPGLRLVRALILGYRRWCSGRGPLRRVGCSFVNTESCSAHGLRMAESAPNAFVAVARIGARLRRCGEVSVYRLRVDGREAMVWGSAHDEPAGLGARLEAAQELPDTRHAVLEASRWVSAHRGRWPLVTELDAELDALRAGRPGPPPRLLVRRTDDLLRSLGVRAGVQLGLIGLVAMLGTLFGLGLGLAPWVLAMGLGVSSVVAARVLATLHRRRRRFVRLLDASAFATAGRLELRPIPRPAVSRRESP